MQETWIRSLGWEDPLEKGVATHSSTLAWRIPWTEEPGELQSIGSQKSRKWLSARMCAHTHTLTHSVSTLGNPAQRQSFLKFVSNMFSESESEVAQLCPNLCDPMDCSPPGSSVHGIFQARVLEWVAISFSRGSSWPRDRTQVSCIVGRCFTIWATRETCSQVTLKTDTLLGFPGGSVVKNPPANARDTGSIPGSGIFPGEGNGSPFQWFLPGRSHGQRSLVGYSPRGY